MKRWTTRLLVIVALALSLTPVPPTYSDVPESRYQAPCRVDVSTAVNGIYVAPAGNDAHVA